MAGLATPSSSCSSPRQDAAGDQGIEADNNGENNNYTPRSNPVLSNFTIIGAPENAASDIGILLREGTIGSDLEHAVVTGLQRRLLRPRQRRHLHRRASDNGGIDDAATSSSTAPRTSRTTSDPKDPFIRSTTLVWRTWFLKGTGNKVGKSDHRRSRVSPTLLNLDTLRTSATTITRTGNGAGASFFDAVRRDRRRRLGRLDHRLDRRTRPTDRMGPGLPTVERTYRARLVKSGPAIYPRNGSNPTFGAQFKDAHSTLGTPGDACDERRLWCSSALVASTVALGPRCRVGRSGWHSCAAKSRRLQHEVTMEKGDMRDPTAAR